MREGRKVEILHGSAFAVSIDNVPVPSTKRTGRLLMSSYDFYTSMSTAVVQDF